MKRRINIIKEERVNPLFFLTFNAVTISFNDNEPLFDNINMTIPYGNILVIKGRVGTGKSTLLRSIAGVVELNGEIVNSARCVHLDGCERDKNATSTVELNSEIDHSVCGVHLDSANTVYGTHGNGVHLGDSDVVDNDNVNLNSNTGVNLNSNTGVNLNSNTGTNLNSNTGINLNSTSMKILDSIYLHSSAEFNFVTGYLKDELILSSILTDKNSDISKFSEFMDRSIYDLSGGELKRLSIMIALEMGRDKVILLDEPLDMLDDKYASIISDEIIEMSKTTPFIIATHDTHFDDYTDTIIEIVAE